ncbi:MAG: hypothetical protein HQL26_09590 [Candidatus Omnitrophica bacterium]|nr:hypothetical protein [Candidatus Omnitrophota bacterium]
MNKNLAAEEKLLNLIRKKKTVSASGQKSKTQEGRSTEKPGFIPLFWIWINRVLLMISIILLVVICIKFYIEKKAALSVSDISSQMATLDEKTDFESEINQTTNENFVGVTQRRDIFSATFEQKKEEAVAPVQVPPAFSERYKLVGIMLDNNPTAILENLQNHKTFFVKKGQNVDGAILEDIKENRVIFRDRDKAVELVR